MNSKVFNSILSVALSVILPVTQVFAQEVQADVTLINQAASSLQAVDLESAELAAADQEINGDMSAPALKREKKIEKITARLSHKLPRIQARLKKDVARMSDSEVDNRLNELGLQPTVYRREVLVGQLTQKVQASLPKVAADVYDAGGVIAYLLKAKKASEQNTASNSKLDKSGRSPAAIISDNVAVALMIALILLSLCVVAVNWTLIGTVALADLLIAGTIISLNDSGK